MPGMTVLLKIVETYICLTIKIEFVCVNNMKKMSGKSHKFEPVNTRWAEEHRQCAQMLKDAGWFVFFDKLKGYNVEVSKEFAKKFTGTQVDFTRL